MSNEGEFPLVYANFRKRSLIASGGNDEIDSMIRYVLEHGVVKLCYHDLFSYNLVVAIRCI